MLNPLKKAHLPISKPFYDTFKSHKWQKLLAQHAFLLKKHLNLEGGLLFRPTTGIYLNTTKKHFSFKITSKRFSLIKRLDAFHIRGIRHILGIEHSYWSRTSTLEIMEKTNRILNTGKDITNDWNNFISLNDRKSCIHL